MRPPLNRIESVEAFFANKELPNVLQIDSATTQYNPRKYVNENITMLKDGSLTDVIAWCRLEHLEKMQKAVESPP